MKFLSKKVIIVLVAIAGILLLLAVGGMVYLHLFKKSSSGFSPQVAKSKKWPSASVAVPHVPHVKKKASKNTANENNTTRTAALLQNITHKKSKLVPSITDKVPHRLSVNASRLVKHDLGSTDTAKHVEMLLNKVRTVHQIVKSENATVSIDSPSKSAFVDINKNAKKDEIVTKPTVSVTQQKDKLNKNDDVFRTMLLTYIKQQMQHEIAGLQALNAFDMRFFLNQTPGTDVKFYEHMENMRQLLKVAADVEKAREKIIKTRADVIKKMGEMYSILQSTFATKKKQVGKTGEVAVPPANMSAVANVNNKNNKENTTIEVDIDFVEPDAVWLSSGHVVSQGNKLGDYTLDKIDMALRQLYLRDVNGTVRTVAF